MKIEAGKTYQGPEGSEWDMVVLQIDNGEAICQPIRPSANHPNGAEAKLASSPENAIPAIERYPVSQFESWATRCLSGH